MALRSGGSATCATATTLLEPWSCASSDKGTGSSIGRTVTVGEGETRSGGGSTVLRVTLLTPPPSPPRPLRPSGPAFPPGPLLLPQDPCHVRWPSATARPDTTLGLSPVTRPGRPVSYSHDPRPQVRTATTTVPLVRSCLRRGEEGTDNVFGFGVHLLPLTEKKKGFFRKTFFGC